VRNARVSQKPVINGKGSQRRYRNRKDRKQGKDKGKNALKQRNKSTINGTHG
jgi:hypothetical protein